MRIRKESRLNAEAHNQLLIHLVEGGVKPADYRRLVKDALRVGRGDHGYLDYTGSNRAANKITDLLTQAARGWKPIRLTKPSASIKP